MECNMEICTRKGGRDFLEDYITKVTTSSLLLQSQGGEVKSIYVALPIGLDLIGFGVYFQDALAHEIVTRIAIVTTYDHSSKHILYKKVDTMSTLYLPVEDKHYKFISPQPMYKNTVALDALQVDLKPSQEEYVSIEAYLTSPIKTS